MEKAKQELIGKVVSTANNKTITRLLNSIIVLILSEKTILRLFIIIS